MCVHSMHTDPQTHSYKLQAKHCTLNLFYIVCQVYSVIMTVQVKQLHMCGNTLIIVYAKCYGKSYNTVCDM